MLFASKKMRTKFLVLVAWTLAFLGPDWHFFTHCMDCFLVSLMRKEAANSFQGHFVVQDRQRVPLNEVQEVAWAVGRNYETWRVNFFTRARLSVKMVWMVSISRSCLAASSRMGTCWFFSIVPAIDGTMMPGLLRLLGAWLVLVWGVFPLFHSFNDPLSGYFIRFCHHRQCPQKVFLNLLSASTAPVKAAMKSITSVIVFRLYGYGVGGGWTGTAGLKVHLHEIFDIRFFSSKASFWSPDQDPKLFSNINSNSPRYSNLKVIPRIIRIRGRKFFCHARAK